MKTETKKTIEIQWVGENFTRLEKVEEMTAKELNEVLSAVEGSRFTQVLVIEPAAAGPLVRKEIQRRKEELEKFLKGPFVSLRWIEDAHKCAFGVWVERPALKGCKYGAIERRIFSGGEALDLHELCQEAGVVFKR